jgi:hypothetical protein
MHGSPARNCHGRLETGIGQILYSLQLINMALRLSADVCKAVLRAAVIGTTPPAD